MLRCGWLLLLLGPAHAAPTTLARWTVLQPDPALPRAGAPSLAWPDPVANPTALCQDAPADWTPFQTARFAVHCAAPTNTTLTLVVSSEDAAQDGIDYFAATVRCNFRGWRAFHLPLARFAKTRFPRGWDQVGNVFWSANWAHDLDPTLQLHLTGVRLDDAPAAEQPWEDRLALAQELLPGLRELRAQLLPLAQRNQFFDPFGRLTQAIETAGAMPPTAPATVSDAVRQLEADLPFLDQAAPWWRTVFLDDAALFAGLDLTHPGLQPVAAAAARAAWPEARAALLDYYRARTKPSWYGRWDSPQQPPVSDLRDSAADALLAHQFTMSPEPTQDLGPAFDWTVFPGVDIEWPTRVHRHFHWSTLAGAYRRTGRDAYATELVRQLFDWAQDNPVERWDASRRRWSWSTLNTTIRIYSSWIDAWLRTRTSPAWTPDALFCYLAALREHGRFLMANHANQGNWVVAEARGLVELGVIFPEFQEAAAWREEGYRRLQHELELQVLADGVHVERSPGYHAMTLDCFLQPVLLGLYNEYPIPGREQFVAKLEQMHELYLYGSRPDRRMEQTGDADPMSVLGMLDRGWQMFRRADMRWLRTNGTAGQAPVYRSYGFQAAGLYISRSAWGDPQALWSLLDWGGFLGHCHEDMGHLSVSAYGTNLLVDTGRHAYSWPARAPFFETKGHNTVLVDQRTQKRRDPLDSWWVSCEAGDAFWGLTDNSEPLRFQRTLVFRQPGAAGPGYWLVHDALDGTGSHRLDQRWHGHESVKATVRDGQFTFAGADQASLVLAPLPAAGLQAAVVPGAVSYAWYQQTPVDVAQFSLTGAVPAGFTTLLYPTPPGTPPAQVTLRRLPCPPPATAFAATIVDRGRTFVDTWLLQPGEPALRTAGPLASDARVAVVRAEGGALTWQLYGGQTLQWDGRDLLRATAPRRAAWIAAPGAAVQEQLTAPAPVEPPREPGGPRFEIAAPPPPGPAASGRSSAFVGPLPAGAVVVQAEEFTAQGGGTVEVSAAKVGAVGRSFLHWDQAGHWLEWRLTPPAGRWRLLLRACHPEPEALRAVHWNGQPVAGAAALAVPGSGGWSGERDDWRTVAWAPPGGLASDGQAVTLRLENVDGRGLNLDWLALIPEG
ncbi:MAG: heparinase II/III family protein [Fimbriimonadaceae bacterium]|nr:heparinase II/III family protein [Fimbriimonadaceae bacterium]